MNRVISTAEISTFDDELLDVLFAAQEMIECYYVNDSDLDEDRRAGGMRYITNPNPVAGTYLRFRERLGTMFQTRTVRCWHYTRLTDDEISNIRANGVAPGTEVSMQARLDNQVTAGRLSSADRTAILASSPLRNSEQAQARLNKFWVTDRAHHHADGGVEPLLSHWGGEVVYFWVQDQALIKKLQALGTATFLELAVPLSSTTRAFDFAESALSAFVSSLGYPPQLRGIDAFLTSPLGPASVLAIHTLSAASFARFGKA